MKFHKFSKPFGIKLILPVKSISFSMGINFPIFILNFLPEDNKREKNRISLHNFQIQRVSDFPLQDC